jgi:PAS domain S-box-containing protein
VDLYDFAPLGYVTLDDDGYVQEINLAGASLLGADRDALIGYVLGNYLAEEDRQAFLDHVRQCARERHEVTCELRLVPTSGRTITTQFHSVPVEGPTDETFCKTAITDITERRRAEEALEAERNLLRTLIDNLPDCVYIKDAESRFVAANLATARVMGAATPTELMGKTDADFYPAELAAAYRADEEAIVRSGQPLVDKDEPHVVRGEPRTILTTKVPLKDRQGHVTGLVGISRDITARTRAEQALREALQRLEAPHVETPGGNA